MVVQMRGVSGDYWTKYTPDQILNILGKYNLSPSIGTRAASMALGKWSYYYQHGSFQNTPEGRRLAAATIAADIARDGGGKFSADQIFTVLQYANAYLLKEQKLPPEKRGPESTASKLIRREKAGLKELVNRSQEAAQAVTSAFTPNSIMQKIGLAALVGVTGLVVWKFIKP